MNDSSKTSLAFWVSKAYKVHAMRKMNLWSDGISEQKEKGIAAYLTALIPPVEFTWQAVRKSLVARFGPVQYVDVTANDELIAVTVCFRAEDFAAFNDISDEKLGEIIDGIKQTDGITIKPD